MMDLDDRRTGDDDRRDHPFVLPSAVWVWFINFIVTSLLIYGAVNARVSVVEAKQFENERRLQRIEDKLDHLIDMAQGR